MRIGHGYDVHRLADDRKLVLGGVLIPHEKVLDLGETILLHSSSLCRVLNAGKIDVMYCAIYQFYYVVKNISFLSDACQCKSPDRGVFCCGLPWKQRSNNDRFVWAEDKCLLKS